jgi:hypothetical protein
MPIQVLHNFGQKETNLSIRFSWLENKLQKSVNPLKTEGILRKISKSDITHPKVEGFQKYGIT